MAETQENNFFATQINHRQNEQQKPSDAQQESQPQQYQEKQEDLTKNSQQIMLKTLLEIFNSYDKHQKGVVSLQQVQKIISQFQNLPKQTQQKIQFYFKLSLPNNEKACTFDQFLFIFSLCENDIENRSIDEQYDYCKCADMRIIDFMRLLNNYRKKCQKQSVYQEAKKSKKKVQQIREKQYERRKNFLGIIHYRQIQGLKHKQQQKFIQFCQTWDEFMNEYENTASQLIKKLSQRQQEELKQFIQQKKQQLGSKIRYSKQIVELQDLEKKLVKAQQYEKADKIKLQIEQLKVYQMNKKDKQDMSKVQLRADNSRKQHVAAMNTLLQKIQKDRNDQSRQRMLDSQKLIVKNKNLITEINHRHNQALKKLYEALHNVTLDQSRVGRNVQSSQRVKSIYGQAIKQRN